MYIRMKKTMPVSTDGTTIQTWEDDGVYDAPIELARSLIKGGLATKSRAPKIEPEETPQVTTETTAAGGQIDENMAAILKNIETPEEPIPAAPIAPPAPGPVEIEE